MQRLSRSLIALTLAGLLAACQGQPLPGAVGPGKRPVTPAAKPSGTPAPLASQAPSVVVPGTPSIAPAAPIIANNGSSLTGQIKAPANLIGNNGGNYRIQAVTEQVPLAGARVRLLNAAGSPIPGFETQTDATGRYGFTSALPAENLVVEVALAGDKGAIRAIVPSGAKQVDGDLVSTLTTSYILDRYVKGQADPTATLNKLPAEVEQETRRKAEAALATTDVPPPSALSAEQVVATVEALRKKDPALDSQLETVKKLLIAAGQSDLGSGRLATEVSLGYLQGLDVAADGSVLISSSGDRRVWRLKADGRIETLAGNGTPVLDSLTGKKALEAGMAAPRGIIHDGEGRLLMIDGGYDDYPVHRLVRLEQDGTVTELTSSVHGVAAAPGPDGQVLMFAYGVLDRPATVVSVAADGTKSTFHTFTADEKPVANQIERFGRDSQGRIYLGSAGRYGTAVVTGEGPGVYRFDPATKALTRLVVKREANLSGLSVDPRGNLFMLTAERTLKVRKPDGTETTLMTGFPADYAIDLAGCALAPDGSAYLAIDHRRVHRVKDGQLTLVAGTTGATSGKAEDLALLAPTGVAVGPEGDMFLADEEAHRVLRILPDRSFKVLAGTGTKGFSGDDGPAVEAQLDMPLAVRLDAAGNVYVVDNQGYDTYRVRKIDKQGVIKTIYTSEKTISDMVVAKDGTVYLADHVSVAMFDSDVEIHRIAPDGTVTTIVNKDVGFQNLLTLALDPDDTLFILNVGSQVLVYLPGEGVKLTTVGGGESFLLNDESGFAIDKDLKFYFADRDNNVIKRWDPRKKVIETIAGPGGSHFTGSGVDDSLLRPGYLTFDAAGNLFLTDTGHKQVKRIAADQL